MERFDVVVYGATGFTGMYIVAQMAESRFYEGVSFAVAGRNKSKLELTLDSVSKKIGKDIRSTPIIIANSDDENSVAEMAKQAKVVINAVGPYSLYGEAIIKACVANGASHVDISGEEDFLGEMALKYNSLAKEKGVYIVGACGWDSIPCDLGVAFLKKNFDGDLNHVEAFIQLNRSKEHGYAMSNGAYQTLLLFVSGGLKKQAELKRTQKKLLPIELKKGNVKTPCRFFLTKVNERSPGGWAVPFPGSETSIVERSEYYAAQARHERPIHLKTFLALPNFISGVLLLSWVSFFGLFAQFGPTRRYLQNHPDSVTFGIFKAEGPTEEQIAGTGFTYYLVGSGYKEKLPVDVQHEGRPNKKMVVTCKGPDPGYMSTSACIVSSALAILKDKQNLPQEGGVYTTASAFRGTNIYEYLKSFNMHFQVETTEDI